MDCVYINLASRPDRRDHLENNFGKNRRPGWALSRFDAVDAAWIEAAGIRGTAKPAEKGCFVSHRRAIRQHLSSDGPLMVLEDDVLFGAKTCETIDESLAKLRESDWDIIFTDICVPSVGTWPDLVRQRRRYEQTKGMQLLGLDRLHFAGATSYILNPRSKRLLAGLLDGVTQIDTAYDLYLRFLIQQGRLRGFVLFPFVTSIADLAEQSSIQSADGASVDVILNWFRRSVWAERDLDMAAAHSAALRDGYGSPEAAVFSGLFEAMLSDRLQVK